jgi:hypothetical protein
MKNFKTRNILAELMKSKYLKMTQTCYHHAPQRELHASLIKRKKIKIAKPEKSTHTSVLVDRRIQKM